MLWRGGFEHDWLHVWQVVKPETARVQWKPFWRSVSHKLIQCPSREAPESEECVQEVRDNRSHRKRTIIKTVRKRADPEREGSTSKNIITWINCREVGLQGRNRVTVLNLWHSVVSVTTWRDESTGLNLLGSNYWPYHWYISIRDIEEPAKPERMNLGRQDSIYITRGVSRFSGSCLVIFSEVQELYI